MPLLESDKPPSGTHMPHPVLTQSSPPSSSLPPPPTPPLLRRPSPDPDALSDTSQSCLPSHWHPCLHPHHRLTMYNSAIEGTHQNPTFAPFLLLGASNQKMLWYHCRNCASEGTNSKSGTQYCITTATAFPPLGGPLNCCLTCCSFSKHGCRKLKLIGKSDHVIGMVVL